MLSLEQAIPIFAKLSTGVRARASGRAFADAAGVARLVRAACEVGGLHVDEAGVLSAGKGDVTPAQSEKRFADAAEKDPAKLKAADDALKALLTREQRLEAVVRGIYASGLAMDEAGELSGT